MFVEKKKISGKEYFYLRISAREGDRVQTKTVAYLGKAPMTKKEIEKKISKISKSKIESVKKQLKEELLGIDVNAQFLTQDQFKKLSSIKKDFIKKLKVLDKKLIEDMFKDFKIYYIYNTTAIEGNTLTLADANLLLNENKSPEGKDLREVYDHLNQRDVFDELLEKKSDVNIDSIIEIHSKLLKNIDKRVGSLRKHNVRVFGADF